MITVNFTSWQLNESISFSLAFVFSSSLSPFSPAAFAAEPSCSLCLFQSSVGVLFSARPSSL